MTDILVVEDHAELGGLLCDFLRHAGYSTTLCADGESGLRYFSEEGARLVVLDVMLSGMDGMAVCQSIRSASNVPILIVSAKTEKDDKLDGLLLGADDYIEKPYDIDILLAKIAAIFKRCYETDQIADNGLRLDRAARQVFLDDRELTLTQKEFDLLQLLMENKGKVMSKDLLFNRIWGFDSESEPQTLTVHIKWLREKIEADSQHPKRILTVWGTGYRYD